MKSIKSLSELPINGYIANREGNVLRMFFSFEKQESNDMDGTPIINNNYWCRSVDTIDISYGGIVDAIITDIYPLSSQYAILANKNVADDATSDITEEKRNNYINEYNIFQSYRFFAKDLASKIINELH